MVIASLAVRLSANIAVFSQQMDRAARRVQQTGRVFTRVGRELSQAISLPLIAGAFGAFRVLLADSARSFGPLFQAVASLKAELHNLFLAIGQELAPVFDQLIGLVRGGIATLRGWLEAFHRLPAGIRQAVIFTLAFLAALGPTLFIVGKLITAIGALTKILPLLITPIGLAVIAVAALAAAAIYVVTHWDWAKLKLALAWTFIVGLFFDGVRAALVALDVLTFGITQFTGITDFLRGKVDALADRTLGNLAARILEAEAALAKTGRPLQETAAFAKAAAEAFAAYNLAIRQVNANAAVFGAEFNRNAASAAALKAEIDALIAAAIQHGVALHAVSGAGGESLTELAARYHALADAAARYTQALNLLGPTVADHVRLLEVAAARGINLDLITRQQLAGLTAYAEALVAINAAIKTAIVDAWTALGERLGAILGGVANGFRGFEKVLLGILGSMLQAVGRAMVAAGTAATFMLKIFANPFALIAAGVGLIALGAALAGAAQRSVNRSLATGGDGGGGASVAAAAPAASQEPVGTLVLRIDRNLLRILDPEFVDIIAQAIQEGKSRNVIIEET